MDSVIAPRFDAARYKQTTREQWQAAAAAWDRWSPILRPGSDRRPKRCSILQRSVPAAGCSTWPQARATRRCRRPRVRGRPDMCSPPTSPRRSSSGAEKNARDAGFATSRRGCWTAKSSTYREGGFDAVISRVGLIYFPDQQAALPSMKRALKPGGRVAAIVYSTPDRNPFFSIPVWIIRARAGLPAPLPGQPGPFSLGAPGVLEKTFATAGFGDVTCARRRGAGAATVGRRMRALRTGIVRRAAPDAVGARCARRGGGVAGDRRKAAPVRERQGASKDRARWWWAWPRSRSHSRRRPESKSPSFRRRPESRCVNARTTLRLVAESAHDPLPDRRRRPDGPDPAQRIPAATGRALIALMRDARRMGCELVVYPELRADRVLSALVDRRTRRRSTPFSSARCPMPPRQRRCSTSARDSRIGFYLGYRRAGDEEGVAAALQHVDPGRQDGASSASTARCICPAMPSTSRGGRSSTWRSATSRSAISAFRCSRAFGGIVGMCICNDRRWPETYRVMGLQGVEMVAARLQHAGAQSAVAGARRPRRLPQPALDAGRRLPERHLGGRRGQGRRRGRRARRSAN